MATDDEKELERKSKDENLTPDLREHYRRQLIELRAGKNENK